MSNGCGLRPLLVGHCLDRPTVYREGNGSGHAFCPTEAVSLDVSFRIRHADSLKVAGNDAFFHRIPANALVECDAATRVDSPRASARVRTQFQHLTSEYMFRVSFVGTDAGGVQTSKLLPMDAVGSGMVQEKEKAFLDEIIQKVNRSFDAELTDDDQFVDVNGGLKGKLLENALRMRQAASNNKEQFANSPDLKDALLHAIIDAFDSHATMSKQALDSERVRDGLKDILPGPTQFYEVVREQSASNRASP